MAASSDLYPVKRAVHGAIRASHPIASGATVYQGSYVGLNSSTARALQAGDQFLGIATARFVQGDGDTAVECETNVQIKAAVTGASGAGDVGKLVYASDDQTLTLTSTSNSLVGVIIEHVSGTTCWVKLLDAAELKAMSEPSA